MWTLYAPCQAEFCTILYLDVLELHWAQRSPIVTLLRPILLLTQIQAQKSMLLDPLFRPNYLQKRNPILIIYN